MVSRMVEGRNIVDPPTGKVVYLIKTRRKKRTERRMSQQPQMILFAILKSVSAERKSDTKKTERRQKIEPDILILRVNSISLSLSLPLLPLFRLLAHLTVLYCRLIFFQLQVNRFSFFQKKRKRKERQNRYVRHA